MPKQTLVNNRGSKVVKCSKLNYGELGELGEIAGVDRYIGCIITKVYGGYTIVYSPNPDVTAFLTSWENDFHVDVRILSPKEKVILEND